MTRPALALSTMYAQQPRFADGGDFARFAAGAGYDGIEISHSSDAALVEAIRDSGALPIVSIHGPAPFERLSGNRANSSLNLAALDDEERAQAVRHHLRSVELAAAVGATTVVVHIGRTSAAGSEEADLKRLHAAGEVESGRCLALREALVARRASCIEPHLAAARRSVEEIVAAARPHGIVIGLENRFHYVEIPHPPEYAQLLEGFGADEAGYWHDSGHAEVMHRLGLLDLEGFVNELAPSAVGAHLTDVRGIQDHLAPGDGEVDWPPLMSALAHLERYTLEINQHQPEESVRRVPGFLAALTS